MHLSFMVIDFEQSVTALLSAPISLYAGLRFYGQPIRASMSPIDSLVRSARRHCGESGSCDDENEERLRSDQLRDIFRDRREEEETKKAGLGRARGAECV